MEEVTIDVETLNIVLKLLSKEIAKYEFRAPEAIALYKFKEELISS